MSDFLHIHSAGSGGSKDSHTDFYSRFGNTTTNPEEKDVIRLAGVGAVFEPGKNPWYMNPKTGKSTMSTGVLKAPQALLGLLAGWVLAAGEENNVLYVMNQLQAMKANHQLPKEILLTGHSRGGLQNLLIAKAIWLMFGDEIKVDMVVSDPVGLFAELNPDKCTIPPNVRSFTSVYANGGGLGVAKGQFDLGSKPQSFENLVFDPTRTAVTSFSVPGGHGAPTKLIEHIMGSYWKNVRPQTCFYMSIDRNIEMENLNNEQIPLIIKDKSGRIYIYDKDPDSEFGIPILTKATDPKVYKELFKDLAPNVVRSSEIPTTSAIFENIQKSMGHSTSFRKFPNKYRQQSVGAMKGDGLLRRDCQFVKTTATNNLPRSLQKWHESVRGEAFEHIPPNDLPDLIWEAKSKSLPIGTEKERAAYQQALYQHGLQQKTAYKNLKNNQAYRKWVRGLGTEGEVIKEKINEEIQKAVSELEFLEPKLESEHEFLASLIGNLKTLQISDTHEETLKQFYLQVRAVNKEIADMAITLKASPFAALLEKIKGILDKVFARLDMGYAELLDDLPGKRQPSLPFSTGPALTSADKKEISRLAKKM